MNETLRQVLAELPEILDWTQYEHPAIAKVCAKLCEALQAASEEIERINGKYMALDSELSLVKSIKNGTEQENQRLQAEIERFNSEIGKFEDISQTVISQDMEIERSRELLDTIESYAGGGSREQEGIGLSAAHIGEMVRKAREGGNRG